MARIGRRFRLVGANIDPSLLMLPGGSLLALLFWVYANIEVLWVSASGRLIRRAPTRTAVYIAMVVCTELALVLALRAPTFIRRSKKERCGVDPVKRHLAYICSSDTRYRKI
jgi:hypothetical protein